MQNAFLAYRSHFVQSNEQPSAYQKSAAISNFLLCESRVIGVLSQQLFNGQLYEALRRIRRITV